MPSVAPLMGEPAQLSDPIAILSANGSKARYGVSYVRSICAQAGVGMTETSPDEDVLAVDCDVKFVESSVGVQVKCTSQFTITGRQSSWKIEPSWRDSWAKSKVPIYFVLVIVAGEAPDWLEHRQKATLHHTAAFWCRVDKLSSDAKSVTVPKSQRLTVATMETWHADLSACFGGTSS